MNRDRWMPGDTPEEVMRDEYEQDEALREQAADLGRQKQIDLEDA